jgi:hypothetical protein
VGSENVALATAVTSEDRVVENLGASRWSTDRAVGDAIGRVDDVASGVDFDYRVGKVRVSRSNATFQRVGETAFRKGGGGFGGLVPLIVIIVTIFSSTSIERCVRALQTRSISTRR